MKFLRNLLDKVEPNFSGNGKYAKFYPLYEMADTFLFTPTDKTKNGPHIRDAVDLKRVMSFVVIAMLPALLFGIFNVGRQVNPNAAIMDMFISGLPTVLPIILVSYLVGGFWEMIFAIVRKHEINEGFLVTGMLIPLVMPPTIPLWMVALATTFGVVIGKEIFGGTGKNFLNPALTGRAFLYFAYPLTWSGDSVWVALDGYTSPTLLGIGAQEGLQGIESTYSWSDAFLGSIPGSVGETSTLFILFGLFILLFTRIASWRIILGVLAGTVFMSGVFNLVGSDTNPMFNLPFYWHFVIGGYAFGLAFMAVEPVSGSHTNLGRWYYGILIGIMVVLIRVVNPAFPEGMMLAILFANLFAPLIDHFIQEKNIKRRKRVVF